MKLPVVVIVLAGCGGSQTYASLRGDIDDADPALARLEVDVSASQLAGAPLEVSVALSDPKRFLLRDRQPAPDACFSVTPDYRVLVDDQPATLTFGGGPTTAGTVSGIELPRTCGGARFRWVAPAAGAPAAPTRITIEHGGKRAEVTVTDLATPRALRVSPSTPLHPGDQVTLDWSPRGDEWSGNTRDARVHIYQPAEFSAEAPVEVDGSRFRFAMPQVRPGPALLDLYTPNLQAHPAIQRCVGVGRCAAGTALAPHTVELVIAER